MKVRIRKLLTILFFQVIAFVNVWRTKVNAEVVEGCIESQLTLTCNETKVIIISSVVLGDSDCWKTNCCPRNNSCIRNPNANHVNEVHSRCNGRQTCSVDVIAEGISCGLVSKWSNNDFERITYDCIDNGMTTTTDTKTNTDETTTTETDFMLSGKFLAISITIVFLSMVIILLIFMISKKKKTWLKIENEMEMSNVRHSTNETIYSNVDQFQNVNSYPSSRSINRVCNDQRCDTLPVYSATSMKTYTARAEANDHQMAMAQGFIYSADDVVFDSKSEKTDVVYFDLEPTESVKMSQPRSSANEQIYEEVIEETQTWMNRMDSVNPTSPFGCPTAPYQRPRHTENNCFPSSNQTYEPQLEPRENSTSENHSESVFMSGKQESDSRNLCGDTQQSEESIKETDESIVVDNQLYVY